MNTMVHEAQAMEQVQARVMTRGTEGEKLRLQAEPDVLYNDPTRFYRYEIGQVDLLSSEEVIELAQSIEQNKRNEKRRYRQQRVAFPMREQGEPEEVREAKHKLVEANLRLVLHIAKRYRGFGVDLMDLVQEGNLGLMHAVEKFDYTRGYKFSTYATWWIRQYVTRALAEQAHTIRVPLYKVEEIKRLARVRRCLQEGQEDEPTIEELAERLEITVQQVISLLSTNQETMSLDMPRRGGDDESPLSDVLEDDPLYSPERIVMTQTLHEQIEDLLQSLTPRERRVLQLRYGLNGGREHSLTEAGKKIGLSHEAVRQVEFRALRKLEHPSRDRMLQDFLG